MSSRKKNKDEPESKDRPSDGAAAKSVAADVKDGIAVKEREDKKASWRAFPGPKDAKAVLRVAMDKSAYAQIVSHAAASLDAEICGILAGTQCEDDDGPFLEISASVRGDTARGGSTHVTFTHETWDVIHRAMEKDHPKLQIVGWYHSHPGFGVEFSEMDLFIQKNFFKANTQIALVIDPLGGQTAMCLDTSSGIQYVDRFWIDGREHHCKVPRRHGEGKGKSDAKSGDAGGSDEDAPAGSAAITKLADEVKTMQARLTQAIAAADDQRAWIYRAVLGFGMLISTCVIGYIGWSIWRSYKAPPIAPPELYNAWSVPVMIDGKPMMLGMQVVKWQVPPELMAAFVEIEKQRQAAEAGKSPQQPSTQPAGAPQTQAAPAAPTSAPAH